MAKKNPRARRRRKVIRYMSFLLLGLLVLAGVVAKYVREDSDKNIFAAKEFYFTSNLLTADEAEYRLNADATSVSFTIGNNADKLRFAEDDVEYKISVNEGATIDKAEGILQKGKYSPLLFGGRGRKSRCIQLYF